MTITLNIAELKATWKPQTKECVYHGHHGSSMGDVLLEAQKHLQSILHPQNHNQPNPVRTTSHW